MAERSKREPVSVAIITFNEAEKIRECLESVSWADEVIVVDSLSTDETVEIAREFTSRVYERPWPGYVLQKNHACSLAEHEWILSVDADERVTPELRDEILEVLSQGDDLADGYVLPRRTFYLGRWIRHGGWYPDAAIRLFRGTKGKFVGEDPHDRVEVDGEVRRLQNDLVHFNYRNISAQMATVDRFSTVSSEVMREKGKSASLLKMILKPPVKFLETYVWKLGFLDGMAGLIIAVLSSYHTFAKFAKLWEMSHVPEGRPRIVPPAPDRTAPGADAGPRAGPKAAD